MQLLKRIFDFYLDASIHVALSVLSLYYITVENLNIDFNFALGSVLFFSTIVCYNFIKYGVEAEKYMIVANRYHKSIQVFSFLCFGGALFYLLQLHMRLWLAISVLTLLSAFYAIPLLPNSKNLRSLGGMKILIVALVWMGFTVALPVFDAKLTFNWDIGILMLQRFLLVLVLLLPFEIRDLKYDALDLRTIPQRLGVEKTKILGYGLVAIYFLLIFLKDELMNSEVLQQLLLSLLLLFVLFKSRKDQDIYYSSFWVEGIPVLWAVSIMVL